jgi:hypothetical protein
MSTKHVRIFVSSTHADRYPLGEHRSDVLEFDLTEPIACKGDEGLYLDLENFSCPISRTNVFEQNKTLLFGGGYGDFSVVLPVGQYRTSDEFLVALQTAITGASAGITATYSALTNKLTLRNTRALSIFLKGTSPLGQLLGGLETDLTLPSLTDVVMPRMLDLSGARCINIVLPSFELNSADSLNWNALSASILASIPVEVGWGEIQVWNARIHKPILSSRKNMSSLAVKLVDENGVDFDISLEWTAKINATITKADYFLH